MRECSRNRCLSCYRKRILYQRNDSWNIDSIERTTSNARHTIGDGDGGKARAIRERISSNARHTVGDGDGGEAGATIERIFSNARHTVGDGDGGEAGATKVFTTYCLPNCCDLNGRKVMTWILWTERMMKI